MFKLHFQSVPYNTIIIGSSKPYRRLFFIPFTLLNIFINSIIVVLSPPIYLARPSIAAWLFEDVIGDQNKEIGATGLCQNSYDAAFVFILWLIKDIQREKEESGVHLLVENLRQLPEYYCFCIHF